MLSRLLFFLFLIVGIDVYAFRAYDAAAGSTTWFTWLYFTITFLSFSSLLLFFLFPLQKRLGISRQGAASVAFMGLSPKLFTALLLIPADIIQLLLKVAAFIGSQLGFSVPVSSGIPVWWSWIAVTFGLLITLAFIYGALFNVYRYATKKVQLRLMQLPSDFLGLRVVQISDIHSGSLSDVGAVEKAVHTINALEPDLIFFTGDLVNNIAEEARMLQPVFAQLRAKHGVYSILGNHDYGDYYYWPDAAAKAANLHQLKDIHRQMGWRLLLNEHVVVQHGGHDIAVAGVENWSASDRFPKYGNLDAALDGLAEGTPVLLLSHDPSHWKAQILEHPVHIDATFSGHTHGMQFGFEWGKLRWSPVQYVYKQWAGMYEHAGRYLYVNRGFGVIGYPGRVGILPEITVFDFKGQ